MLQTHSGAQRSARRSAGVTGCNVPPPSAADEISPASSSRRITSRSAAIRRRSARTGPRYSSLFEQGGGAFDMLARSSFSTARSHLSAVAHCEFSMFFKIDWMSRAANFVMSSKTNIDRRIFDQVRLPGRGSHLSAVARSVTLVPRPPPRPAFSDCWLIMFYIRRSRPFSTVWMISGLVCCIMATRRITHRRSAGSPLMMLRLVPAECGRELRDRLGMLVDGNAAGAG